MLAEDNPKTQQSPEAAAIGAASPNVFSRVRMPVIKWEKLPDDFILPNDPVDTLSQPWIAAVLTDSLYLAKRVPETAITCTNYGLIATVDGQTIAKAPDWAYIANITVPIEEVNRSYTPHLHGEVPTIVLEFLSHIDRTEYSSKPENPMGKWYYYQKILKVPYYGIFDPDSGDFQVYWLNELGSYDRLALDPSGRYWIEPMQLSIAAWHGKLLNRMGWWLRWWDAEGTMLLWATEKVEAAEQRTDAARQRSKELGLDPE